MHRIYYIAYIAYLFLILSLIFLNRKKPIQRFNWILVLMVVPGIGLLLYLFIGSNTYLEYKRRRLIKKHGDSFTALEEVIKKKISHSMDLDSISSNARKFHERYCGSIFTVNNRVNVYTNGTSKYEHLFCDLEKAKDYIHILYFTIHNDEIGQELVNILTKKAKQGVEVRLLYDSIGCFMTLGYASSLLRGLKEAGGKVVNIRPHPLDVNYRNHRKIVIIDGKIGYTGGMNIGRRYKYGLKDKPWRDTHVRIAGSAVHCLQKIFLSDWLTSTSQSYTDLNKELSNYFPDYDSKNELGVQLIASGLYNKYKDDDDTINLGYFNLISRANKRVWIQTPYFVPSDIIFQSLKAIASVGVDVRIMTSSFYVYGGMFYQHIANYFLRPLVDSGVRVFKYDGLMHAKTMLVDDNAVCIGTVNLNVRSLENDDELYAYFESSEFASRYEEIFKNDMEVSTELEYEKFQKQYITNRAVESVLSFFSPLA